MSFLQLVLSLDKTKEEIILLWRICQFDRYRNTNQEIKTPQPLKPFAPMFTDGNQMNFKQMGENETLVMGSPHQSQNLLVNQRSVSELNLLSSENELTLALWHSPLGTASAPASTRKLSISDHINTFNQLSQQEWHDPLRGGVNCEQRREIAIASSSTSGCEMPTPQGSKSCLNLGGNIKPAISDQTCKHSVTSTTSSLTTSVSMPTTMRSMTTTVATCLWQLGINSAPMITAMTAMTTKSHTVTTTTATQCSNEVTKQDTKRKQPDDPCKHSDTVSDNKRRNVTETDKTTDGSIMERILAEIVGVKTVVHNLESETKQLNKTVTAIQSET